MPSKSTKPTPGHVVVLTFKGTDTGALGVWSGKSWFIWRKSNGGLTGEPNNWHIVEDMLIRAWVEIPPGFLHTVIPDGAGPHAEMTVDNIQEPWRLMMASCPATRKMLRDHDRRNPLKAAKVKWHRVDKLDKAARKGVLKDLKAACARTNAATRAPKIGNSTKKAVAALVVSQRTRTGSKAVESTGSVLGH